RAGIAGADALDQGDCRLDDDVIAAGQIVHAHCRLPMPIVYRAPARLTEHRANRYHRASAATFLADDQTPPLAPPLAHAADADRARHRDGLVDVARQLAATKRAAGDAGSERCRRSNGMRSA